MANRRFEQFQLSLEKQPVNLFAEVSFGSSGAPTIVRGKGITSISRSAQGVFTINLKDKYQRLLGFNAVLLSGAAPAAPIVSLRALSSNSPMDADRDAIGMATRDAAGASTDPANGERMFIHIVLSNSTAL